MKRFILFFFMIALSTGIYSQQFEEVTQGLSNGNASDIGKHIDAAIQLTMEGESNELDRQEAMDKLRSFFLEHTVNGFDVVHKGVSEKEIHYLIGELETTEETYRVTLYIKEAGETYFIQSLEIEHG